MHITIDQSMSSQPITATTTEPLSTAFSRMKKEGIRHLPVIDNHRHLIGIISERDFQRAMWPVTTLDEFGLPEGPTFRKGATVGEYMSWPVKGLPESTDLLIAIQTMISQKISAIVVTRENQMVGILTHEDLLKAFAGVLQEPPSLKERALNFTYNSPIGKVAELLSLAGV